ncbi:MAG: cytochrome C [Alphaproteobacteria bacterium]|nr:cytochrome C [Alphaproteobacteria bacterium]
MSRAAIDRRRFLASAAAAGTAASFPTPAVSQKAGPSLAVIGGGFGGVACARVLRKAIANATVTLVEANATYTAPPLSNAAIAGIYPLDHQRFGYDGVRKTGVAVALSAATAVDPGKRTVTLANGTQLAYDRLVISPGVAMRWNAIPGYDRRAAEAMPHAWNDGGQVGLLRKQIEAMDDGGTVVVSAPVNPARCPPAPYERASLIAHYLKTHKPRSKVIVLDAKDGFTMQRLFQAAWKELYPGMIEWIPPSSGGSLASVDAETRTISTDFDKYKAAVASIIPPQTAGHAAELAGVADRTGWCPVDPMTFESKLVSGVHVIGDAAIAGAMPRSASAAQSQATICAQAIAALLAGRQPAQPTLSSSCYSLIAPDYAISQRGKYRPVDGQYAEADGGLIVSPLDAPRSVRKREANEAEAWYRAITGEVFG